MKIKDRYVPANLKGKRTIVVSDIHGELELFNALLSKVDYSEEDILIINGDIIDIGQNSLGVLRKVMKLLERDNVYLIEGNCDIIFEQLEEEWLYPYMSRIHTVIHECLEEMGKSINDFPTQKDLKAAIYEKYSKERLALLDLPIALETEDFIFVHAGVNEVGDYKETLEWDAITMQRFAEKSHTSEKMIVVGHIPVSNYHENGMLDHRTLIDNGKRIISIDGGNQVKQSGVLNALVITYEEDEYRIETTFVHPFEMREVIQDFEVSYQEPHAFTWPDFEIEVFDGDEHFKMAKHLKTDTDFMVKTEWIIEREGKNYLRDDYTDLFIDVYIGESVAIIGDYKGYAYVLKDGVAGWVPNEVFGM